MHAQRRQHDAVAELVHAAVDDWAAVRTKARVLSEKQRAALRGLSVAATELLSSKRAYVEAMQNRGADALFRVLAQTAPMGIIVTDEAANSVFTNPAWSEMTGIPPGQAEGRGWLASAISCRDGDLPSHGVRERQAPSRTSGGSGGGGRDRGLARRVHGEQSRDAEPHDALAGESNCRAERVGLVPIMRELDEEQINPVPKAELGGRDRAGGSRGPARAWSTASDESSTRRWA